MGVWVVASPRQETPAEEADLRPARLSRRQLQVLRHLAAGLTTGQIALRLGIGKSTVTKNIAMLKHRLGAGTRAALVRRANRDGLLD
jgi:DNA-binding NarL/FixJ family response regulator